MEEEIKLLLPKKKPKTLGDVLKWHIKIFEDCLKFELEKQIIESAIEKTNQMIREVKEYLKEEGHSKGAKLALSKLNDILEKYKEKHGVTKLVIKSLHKTNEAIVGSLLKSCLGESKVKELYMKHKDCHPNILHGTGWMVEYLAAKEEWDKGKAAFLTFGTFMDPAKVDLIILPNSLDEPIELGLDYDNLEKSLRSEDMSL